MTGDSQAPAKGIAVAGDERYVAKLVDHLDAQGLDAGLRLAEFAAARGLPSGACPPSAAHLPSPCPRAYWRSCVMCQGIRAGRGNG
jgi:hypothetical protein